MSLDREEYFFTPRYTRGQVCKVLGVTKDTLRHYEKCGIINPQENNRNGYKYYSIAELEILSVILFLRAMDVSIQDIPKFIKCKDISTYSNFLDEQINRAIEKITYWNHVKDILSYLKKTLEDYKKVPHKVTVVENTIFRFCVATFDYNNYDIEKMVPARMSNTATYNVIKLKIVDRHWVFSNREDMSGMLIGHLCDEDEIDDDICVTTIPKALMITTLENLEEIPQIIKSMWEKNKDKYDFDDKVYIIEHTFFNIFNQEALLRNIYLPIISLK